MCDNDDERNSGTNEERIHGIKPMESNGEENTPNFPSNYKVLPDLSEETDSDACTCVGQHIYSLQNDVGETFDIFETVKVGFIGRYRGNNQNEQWVQILEKHSPTSSLQWRKDAGFETKYTNEEAIHRLYSEIPLYPINSKYDPTTEQYVVNELDVTTLPHHLEPDMFYWEPIIDSRRANRDQIIVYKNRYDELLAHVKQSSHQLASTWHTLNNLNPQNEDDLDELEATLHSFMSAVEVDR